MKWNIHLASILSLIHDHELPSCLAVVTSVYGMTSFIRWTTRLTTPRMLCARLCYTMLCYIVCSRYVLPGPRHIRCKSEGYCILIGFEYDAVQKSESVIRVGWDIGCIKCNWTLRPMLQVLVSKDANSNYYAVMPTSGIKSPRAWKIYSKVTNDVDPDQRAFSTYLGSSMMSVIKRLQK